MNSNLKPQTIPSITKLSASKIIFLKISQQISDPLNSLIDSKITLRNSTQRLKKPTNFVPIITNLFLYQPKSNLEISKKTVHTKISNNKSTTKLFKAKELTSVSNTLRCPSVGSLRVEFLVKKTIFKALSTTKINTTN